MQVIFITVNYLEICYFHIFLFRTHRPMSLVDVSGQNRTCLPSTPYQDGGGYLGPPWKVGFSETAGQRERYFLQSNGKTLLLQSYQTLMPRKFILKFIVSNWVLKYRVYENKDKAFNLYPVYTHILTTQRCNNCQRNVKFMKIFSFLT